MTITASPNTRNWIVAIAVTASCLATPLRAEPTEAPADSPRPRIFVLSFNRWGDIANPAEVNLVKHELASDPSIERIIIFSYGWLNDGESSYATYHNLFEEMYHHLKPGEVRPRVAVIAVGWDSAQSGFRKLLNDLVPFPALASLTAAVPDMLLYPLSFWSKAATADRIGFGGLRTSLNEIFEYAYPGGKGTPDIFLSGHSFGTRIISQLMQDRVGGIAVHADPFVGAAHVRGAVLLQPAISQTGLHRQAKYPILITQSEHDHAVGAMFPVANFLINTSIFTSFEALFRYQFFDVAGQATERISAADQAIHDQIDSPILERDTGLDSVVRSVIRATGRGGYLVLRGVAEVVSIPFALASGVVVTPINYAYVQTVGLLTHPVDHVMDTLAQLPLLEIATAWASDASGRSVAWGRRGKGFLNLGALNESVGRLYTPAMIGDLPGGQSRIYDLGDLRDAQDTQACGLPRCEGILLLDATDIIEVGSFGLNLNDPLVDYTLGWLDPLGSHLDYRNEDVARTIADFFDATAVHSKPKLGPSHPQFHPRERSGTAGILARPSSAEHP